MSSALAGAGDEAYRHDEPTELMDQESISTIVSKESCWLARQGAMKDPHPNDIDQQKYITRTTTWSGDGVGYSPTVP